MQQAPALTVDLGDMTRQQFTQAAQCVQGLGIIGLDKKVDIVEGSYNLAGERLHGPHGTVTGAMPRKQVDTPAARRMYPQSAVVRDSRDDLGDCIVTDGDNVCICTWAQRMQVVGSTGTTYGCS
jgi:hypothetical protein